MKFKMKHPKGGGISIDNVEQHPNEDGIVLVNEHHFTRARQSGFECVGYDYSDEKPEIEPETVEAEDHPFIDPLPMADLIKSQFALLSDNQIRLKAEEAGLKLTKKFNRETLLDALVVIALNPPKAE